MGFVWDQIGVDNRIPDLENLSDFYSHPVWLLNGLFIEQHEQSLKNRNTFATWVQSVEPERVADFGGGYGTLARAISDRCSETRVEVVDPYPRPEALRASAGYHNLAFAEKLDGEYGLIIATDVFEHVTDPVGLADEVGRHIPVGGRFLTAYHFAPSIKCHLSSDLPFQAVMGPGDGEARLREGGSRELWQGLPQDVDAAAAREGPQGRAAVTPPSSGEDTAAGGNAGLSG